MEGYEDEEEGSMGVGRGTPLEMRERARVRIGEEDEVKHSELRGINASVYGLWARTFVNWA